MYSVAIVEDNKSAVTAIVKSMDWERFYCKISGVAYSGDGALKLLEAEKPDIMIINLQMSGLNGPDLMDKLKIKKNNIQFIIISGYSHPNFAAREQSYGDCILKPVRSGELEQVLKKAIERLESRKKCRFEEELDTFEEKIYFIRMKKEEYSLVVSKAIDYVDRHIQDNISLADISEELMISTSYFSRIFKKETGVGFASFVTMVKMENARILLKNPQNSVRKIAGMLGYCDYSYFFQVFKKYFGISPSDFLLNGD